MKPLLVFCSGVHVQSCTLSVCRYIASTGRQGRALRRRSKSSRRASWATSESLESLLWAAVSVATVSIDDSRVAGLFNRQRSTWDRRLRATQQQVRLATETRVVATASERRHSHCLGKSSIWFLWNDFEASTCFDTNFRVSSDCTLFQMQISFWWTARRHLIVSVFWCWSVCCRIYSSVIRKLNNKQITRVA